MQRPVDLWRDCRAVWISMVKSCILRMDWQRKIFNFQIFFYIYWIIYTYILFHPNWHFTVNFQLMTNPDIDRRVLSETVSVHSQQWVVLAIFIFIYIWVWNYAHFVPQWSKLYPTNLYLRKYFGSNVCPQAGPAWSCHCHNIMYWVLFIGWCPMPWNSSFPFSFNLKQIPLNMYIFYFTFKTCWDITYFLLIPDMYSIFY